MRLGLGAVVYVEILPDLVAGDPVHAAPEVADLDGDVVVGLADQHADARQRVQVVMVDGGLHCVLDDLDRENS